MCSTLQCNGGFWCCINQTASARKFLAKNTNWNINSSFEYKLDGSAPLTTDPTSTSFTSLSKKERKKRFFLNVTCDTWHVTRDMWHVTCDMWHVTCDMWHVTRDTWHVTCDMWHVTGGGRWKFSKNFSFLAPTDWEWLTYLSNHDAVYTTAPSFAQSINYWIHTIKWYINTKVSDLFRANKKGNFKPILRVSHKNRNSH